MLRVTYSIVVGGMIIAAASEFAPSALALGRATNEQMGTHLKDVEKLWVSPVTNYNTICAFIIKPCMVKRDELLNRLNAMLAITDKQQEIAALYYLIGETYYWSGLSTLRDTKNRSVILDVGENVTRSFLSAWDAINKADKNKDTTKLRQTITSRLNQLLSTSVCGGNISSNLKQEVVSRYIDRLDSCDLTNTSWSVAQRSKAYSNLGIHSRMDADIPIAMPTNFTSVCKAMFYAWDIGATNRALQFADVLQKKYEPLVLTNTLLCQYVANLFVVSGDLRAVSLLQMLTAVDPKAWLGLYDFSILMDSKTNMDQRAKYLEYYIKGMEEKEWKSMDYYHAALKRLMANGDYKLVVQLANKALSDPSMPGKKAQDGAYMWRIKAIAHEKCDEKVEATNAYHNAFELAPMIKNEDARVLFLESLKCVGFSKVNVEDGK